MKLGERSVPGQEQSFVTGNELYPDDDEADGSCRYESDFAYFKPRTDLLLAGKFFAPGKNPIKAGRAIFQVGSYSKTLAVFGNRYWDPISRTISDPEPFTEMVLRYENSFGGPKHSKNPVGKGISKIKLANGQTVWPLPNIEDINNLIDSSDSQPEPAGFGPLGAMWADRYKKIGTYKGDWLQTRWPWYPIDFDWSYFNAAPLDMQIEGYLKGDESVYFENLHPECPVYKSRLPGISPRLFINKKDENNTENSHFIEVPLNLDTLWVDMETEKLVLVWRGLTEILSEDYEELTHALIVSEDIHDKPSSAASYYDLFLRLLSEEAFSDEQTPDEVEVKTFSLNEIDAEIKKAEAEVRTALVEAGIDPDREIPEPSEEDKENSAKMLEAYGIEFAQPAETMTREGVKQRIAAGEELSREDLRGIDLSGLDLSGGVFREAILSGINLEGAILASADLSGADLFGSNVRSANLSAANLTDADLTGANLSKANLSEAILDDAILDGANLHQARMEKVSANSTSFLEADFSHASLAQSKCQAADFSKASFFESDFQDAHLADASLEQATGIGVNFTNADLTGLRASGGTNFSKGIFRNISAPYSIWENAVLDEADFSFAMLEGANFASASLKKLVFFGADLRFARLSKSNLYRANCIRMNLFQATLERAYLVETDFSAANLYGAEFLGATISQTKFKQANLKMTKLQHHYERI